MERSDFEALFVRNVGGRYTDVGALIIFDYVLSRDFVYFGARTTHIYVDYDKNIYTFKGDGWRY